MSKKPFLIISNIGEAFLSRKELFGEIAAKGYEVHVAAPEISSDVRKVLQERGYVCHNIELSRTGLNPVKDLKSIICLKALIKKIQPAGVFCYTIKPVIYGLIAAYSLKVPVRGAMITGLGYAFLGEAKPVVAWVVKKLYRFALKRATSVFFQNKEDQQLFWSNQLVNPNKCTLINGSGVNLSHFNYVQPSIYDGDIHFLLIARLLTDKGIREYMQAAQQIRTLHKNAFFHIVGWIDSSNPAAISQQELDEWINSETIVFHGRLEDVRPILEKTHVSVLPSYREGVPRVSLEAMAIGRPVVTTNAPGCKDTVIEGYNGFLVPIKDANSLAQAMLKFIEQPDLILTMGKNSRKLTMNKFDVNMVNKKILTTLSI